MTSAYILLGLAGSARREILADLILNGLEGDARVYLTNEFDGGDGSAMPSFSGVQYCRWGIAGGVVSLDSPETAPETVFLLTNGRENPVDQMEILSVLLPRLGWEVTRVLTVINCALLARHGELGEWYKACIHFSDVALLSCREAVEANWLRKFINAHREAHNPCLLEPVTKGCVENAPRVLVREARRLSMIFDDTDPLDDMEFDENNLPNEPFDLIGKPDPYFERVQSGARRIQLPDVACFLGAS
ncbi:MAG: hypothetical protein LBD01_00450 [Puniceicoccales bacterium]|nr:hypothetical protein [Puniceicoccales bacterium]